MIIGAGDESDYGSSTTTITVVEILPPSLSITSYSMTIQSTPSKTMTSIATTETNTLLPTSFISLASSTSTSALISTLSSSLPPLLQDTKTSSSSSSSSSLSSLDLVGIVIACIFAFFIGIFFAIRIWFKKKRASKLRRTWLRSSVVGIRHGTDAPESSYEPKTILENRNSQALALSVQIPSPYVSVPPISYNNDALYQSPVSSSPPVFISPVYSPGLTLLSPYSTTVVCTFIPSLPDELTIFIGETLHVLTEYEDGWSLCIDCRGEQGMVPNECLDRGSSTGLLPSQHAYGSARSSTRVTSLAQVVRPSIS